jgi:hypothetical protein
MPKVTGWSVVEILRNEKSAVGTRGKPRFMTVRYVRLQRQKYSTKSRVAFAAILKVVQILLDVERSELTVFVVPASESRLSRGRFS